MSRARRARLLPAAALALALAACQGTTPTLQGVVDGIGSGIDSVLGAKTLPGKYAAEIYAIHVDDRTWRFQPDAADALERCREAVRGLSTADYASWRETAVVIELLASMADEHPSALVRAEALDSLARMSSWTHEALRESPRKVSEEDVVAALQRIIEGRKRDPADPDAAAELADALNVVAAHRFDRAKPLPEKPDRALLVRGSRTQLSMARSILKRMSGGALDGFDADPRVRDALDRVFVSSSAAAIRLAMVAAAVGGPTEVVRSTAVRDLVIVRPEQCARLLGTALRTDDASGVRREAARALGSLPEAEAVPELIEGIGDDRIDVRTTAAASLEAVTGQTFGDDRGAWVRWWEARRGAATAPVTRP